MARASRARSAAIIHLSIFGRGFLRSPVSRLVLSFLSPSPSRSLLCTRTRYYRGTTTVNHNLARIPLPRSSLPPAGFHGPPPPPPPTRALSPRALSRDLAHDSRARATLALSFSLPLLLILSPSSFAANFIITADKAARRSGNAIPRLVRFRLDEIYCRHQLRPTRATRLFRTEHARCAPYR